MKKKIRSVLRAPENYILLVTLFADLVFLSGIISDFRILTCFCLLIFSALLIKTKNALVASFLTAVFVLPLFKPNKYYLVEVIPGTELLHEGYKVSGYLLGYGLNVSNVFIFLSIVFMLRSIINFRKRFQKSLTHHLLLLIFVIIGFLTVGVLSISTFSPYPVASYVWLLQYSQLFIIPTLMLYIHKKSPKNINLIYAIVLGSVVLQFVLSLWQFAKQASIGLPLELAQGTWFALGLDENNAILRVAGSLAFHNQLALTSLLYGIILFPYWLKTQKTIYGVGLFMVLVIIILTQSRSIWLSTGLTGVIALFMYREIIMKKIKKIFSKKTILYASLLLLSTSYIIFPRLVLSLNAPYEGAGIPFRIRLFREGAEAFLQNPWLGYGIGTNEYVLHSLFPDGVMSVYPTALHMGLMQLALEVGILGCAFFLFPFFYVLRSIINRAIQKKLNKKDILPYFIFIAGIGAVSIYYSLLPHVGIIEFAYLGLILGFGFIGVINYVKA